MLITDVKTAFKIADVKFINNSTKLDFVYLIIFLVFSYNFS